MLKSRQLLTALLLSLTVNSVQAGDLLDRIVAVVGDDVVMLSELREQAGAIFKKLRRAKLSNMPGESAIIKQAMDSLIVEKVELAEAERLGIQADPQTLEKAMATIAKNNGLTLLELRDTMHAEGLNYDEFRDNLRQTIILRRLHNREITNRIQVTKTEIDQFLTQNNALDGGRDAVHLQHILIGIPDGGSAGEIDDARRMADGLVARLRDGEDFAILAQTHSVSRQASEGGDLGWMKMPDVPSLFSQSAQQMKRGEIVGPLQAGSGFHIIRLKDYQGGDRNIVRQTKARHILVRTNEITSDEDARQRLEQLRERLVNGDDFATLARSHSEDTASAIKGGDLGWVSPGNMVPEFEEKMNALPEDGIGQPFKSRFGWHLIQVNGHREHDATSKTLRDKARQAVIAQKTKEATIQYQRRLRDEAYIDLRLDDLYQE